MANYTFLDASGATQTAASSVVGGVNYPIIKISDPVSVVGVLTQSGTNITSVSGLVNMNSVIGTYAEDSQHNSGDTGFFVMGVRNDTLASVTSNTNDYSPVTVGAVGEVMVANSPLTTWISGTASALSTTTQGTLVPVIPAQGASVFTYITGLQLTNFTASSVLATLFGATGSVVGYATIPGNQTIPINYPNGLKTNANAAFSVSILSSPIPSVFLSAQGFISKT